MRETTTPQSINCKDLETIHFDSLLQDKPIILRNLVWQWPAVQADDEHKLADHIRGHSSNKPVTLYHSPPENHGTFFYDKHDPEKLNFSTNKKPFEEALELIFSQGKKLENQRDTYYIGTASLPTYFPTFCNQNSLSLPFDNIFACIWIGNQTTVAAHWDVLNNIACCVGGERTFTLFPPEQIENLYPGSLDHNPAGQAISLVNFDQPDLNKYPKFSTALKHSLTITLKPGDAVYIPAMWWHHVKATANFNVLVNYWWRNTPQYADPGINVLEYALLSLRDLPAHEKQAWKSLFDYYIFSEADKAIDHIPQSVRGSLSLDARKARQLRTKIIANLNR